MMFDQLGSEVDALLGRNIRKSNKPRVRDVMQMNELSEVGVDGDENPTLGFGLLQQRPVTRIRTEFSGLNHVVTPAAQPIGEPASGAPIHQELHRPLTDTAASVSPAMTACA